MKKIKLTQNKYALVDDDDFEFLNQWKWCYDTNGYAVRSPDSGKILMHRLINKTPKGLLTDHINRNRLDNRKENLRSVNSLQNRLNSSMSTRNTSGYIGIVKIKKRRNVKRWRAFVSIKGKQKFFGYFTTSQEAIIKRKELEKKYYA